ncbi:2092_t:CDS:10 [Ambispora leptoticha]|uniref:2092_t:CDS:1 n=1 Tax=Ambispora leptoticha TaxID=144679 RepID=A0A9N8YTQ0_9GLOM|nr:2092_t:CDS:10 [Ambispora leptoticha]
MTKPFLAILFLLLMIEFTRVKAQSSQDAAENISTIPRRHDYKHTFKKPYTYNESVPFFDTFGNALLAQEFIRLAPSVPNHSGAIWSQLPNTYKEWEVEFTFKIYGNYYIGGRGIGFWYTKDRGELGPVLGSKDQWEGIGIFFETADASRNRAHPLIMAQQNDGKVIYSNLTDPDKRAFGGCYRQFRNAPSPIHVKVTYYNDTIKLAIDANNNGQHYLNCFEANDIKIPTGYYFGLSAAAEGGTPDDHDVLSFELYELNPPPKQNVPLRPHEEANSKLQSPEEYVIPEDVQKRIEEVTKVVNSNTEESKDEDTRSLDFVKGMQIQILETLEVIQEQIDHLGNNVATVKQNNFPHTGGFPSQGEGHHLTTVIQKLDRIISGIGGLEARIIHVGSAAHDNSNPDFKDELQRIIQKLDALDARVTGQHYQTQKVIMDANSQAVESTTSTWMWIIKTNIITYDNTSYAEQITPMTADLSNSM